MIKNIDELSVGGRGIQIMWHLTDELSYTRTPTQQNCLLLVKNYRSKGWSQSLDFAHAINLKPLMNVFHHFQSVEVMKINPQNNIGDTPLQKLYLQVNTELKAVDQVLQWYEQLELLQIPKQVLAQCQLALVEGITNAVRHAHKGLPLETPIKVEITVFNNRLEMKVWDYGQPFDLKAKLREILTSKSMSTMEMT
jgi:serine/threonine-protein kinase RsbW